jgi:hypothetical protein
MIKDSTQTLEEIKKRKLRYFYNGFSVALIDWDREYSNEEVVAGKNCVIFVSTHKEFGNNGTIYDGTCNWIECEHDEWENKFFRIARAWAENMMSNKI